MRKYIEIAKDALERILSGKFVEGSLHLDKATGKIVFNMYNRLPRQRLKDKLIRFLEHGWVRESLTRYKVYESVPKNIGTANAVDVLERDVKVAVGALIDNEIINRV